MNMESNLCLGCRFGSVKIEALVPEKCNLEELAKKTREYAADIFALTGQKPIHYALTFDSGQGSSQELNFKVNCTCILNVKMRDCLKFNLAEGNNCRIKHLQQVKPASRGLGIEVSETV